MVAGGGSDTVEAQLVVLAASCGGMVVRAAFREKESNQNSSGLNSSILEARRAQHNLAAKLEKDGFGQGNGTHSHEACSLPR